jgi:predicted Zn-dependent protease
VTQQHDDRDAVRHLIELGYVDPQEVALREAAVRRQLEAELQQAISSLKQGRVAEAVAWLERLKVDDAEWAAPHQLLADVYHRSGDWHKAEAELKWLEYHGVESPRLSMAAAGIAIARRQFISALELLEYASHVEPELTGVQTMLGAVLLRSGHFERAAKAFERALAQNADDSRALDGMAALCLHHRDYDDAANWALSAVEKDMQFGLAHYHLGVALTHLNRPTEAVAALEACARADGACIAPFYWLSRIAKQQLHDPVRAIAYREQCRQRLQQRRKRRATSTSQPHQPNT